MHHIDPCGTQCRHAVHISREGCLSPHIVTSVAGHTTASPRGIHQQVIFQQWEKGAEDITRQV